MSQTLFSQDYSLFVSGESVFFSTADPVPYPVGEGLSSQKLILLGIRIDSSKTADGFEEDYFPYFLRNTTEGLCPGPSWLGPKAVTASPGITWFFNQNEDTITIDMNKGLNESWNFFTLSPTSYLSATVSNIETVIDTSDTDDIKDIILQAKDDNGNNLDHIFNGQMIRVSKNYGILQVFDLFYFPEQVIVLESDRYKTEVYKNLSARQTFSYEPGDEFHYKGIVDAGCLQERSYKRYIVLEKSSSANSDTVIYTMDYSYYSEFWDVSCMGKDSTFIRDTLQMKYIFSERLDFNLLPYEPVYNTEDHKYGYQRSYIRNDTIYKEIQDYYILNQKNCLETPIGTGVFHTYTYSAGLGLTDLTNWDGNYNQNEKLIYYKKDGITWGTPINFGILTNLKRPSESLQVTFFPVPAERFLYIETNEKMRGKAKISIMDQLGETVYSITKEINGKTSLELPEALKGVYIIDIKTESHQISRKKIIIH